MTFMFVSCARMTCVSRVVASRAYARVAQPRGGPPKVRVLEPRLESAREVRSARCRRGFVAAYACRPKALRVNIPLGAHSFRDVQYDNSFLGSQLVDCAVALSLAKDAGEAVTLGGWPA
jgi:hypothetical protein